MKETKEIAKAIYIRIEEDAGIKRPAKILISISGKINIIANAVKMQAVSIKREWYKIFSASFSFLACLEDMGNIALLIGMVPKKIIFAVIEAIA